MLVQLACTAYFKVYAHRAVCEWKCCVVDFACFRRKYCYLFDMLFYFCDLITKPIFKLITRKAKRASYKIQSAEQDKEVK